MRIYITGHSGFVGKYISSNLYNYDFVKHERNGRIDINEEVVLHFAGKAQDELNVNNYDDYYQVNTELTKKLYDKFLISKAKIFISLSSVKAVADFIECDLIEGHLPNPKTHYGKSKLLAEQYILSKKIPSNKRVYILRPCMIHGPGNTGNLKLLYKFVSNGLPWPLGNYNNKRSFCSIDNLLFIIKELIEREDIPSGVYNVSDDDPQSTNEVISLIAKSLNKKPKIWKIPIIIIHSCIKIGNLISLSISHENLQKLTESYVVSNSKIKFAIGKNFPVTSKQGLLKTFKSFNIKKHK